MLLSPDKWVSGQCQLLGDRWCGNILGISISIVTLSAGGCYCVGQASLCLHDLEPHSKGGESGHEYWILSIGRIGSELKIL